MTRARSIMLHLFFTSERPLCASDIGVSLQRMGISPNKTTVYRELEFLVKENLVQELNFNQATKYYELKSQHHHHVVCKMCGRVEEVSLGEFESLLPGVEATLKRTTKFAEIDHALEFFGICNTCQ